MNETPQMNNKLARVALYKLLSEFLLHESLSEDARKNLEHYINHAMKCTHHADTLCNNYYIDVREFSGWLGITQGRKELESFMELIHQYKNRRNEK